LAHLRALAELALSAPKAFEERSDAIMDYVMKEIMFKASPSNEVSLK
jgi:sister-chromatid-cohesion protein PDS5